MDGLARKPLTAPYGEHRMDGPLVPDEPQGDAEFHIDPWAGRIEHANADARALLHIPSRTVLPVAIDSAMPAMRRLREIGSGAPAAGEEELQLWCGGRVVRVAAKVSKEIMSNGRPRMVVRALNATGASSPHAQTAGASSITGVALPDTSAVSEEPSGSAAISNENDAAPPVPRDDLETLREIARRIREGHKPVDLGSPRPVPVLPVEAAAVSAPQSSGDSEAVAQVSPVTPEAAAQTNSANPFEGTNLPPRQPASPPDPRTLSKVAHELKTPLSAIAAAAEIMRDQQLGPMGNDVYLGYAGDIYESARHALDVINAMLTGSAREQRRIEVVDLNTVATAVVSVMQPLARSSGIDLEADCGDERIGVVGDATAIRQIIYNLVSNAIKFTPKGGEVHLSTGYLPKGVPFFVVRDTGEGMDEQDIVAAFYRDDAGIGERPGGGWGIGLPLVRRLAEMMEATIDVDSKPGHGTVVLVSFPRH